MTENIRLEDSSSTPLATVQDIQNRLLRPASLLSPLEALNSSQLKLNLKRKLEDYLDPVLLAVVSSKIGRSKKLKTETNFKRDEVKGFEWPDDELKVFAEEDSKNKAADLNGDFDVAGGVDDGDQEIGGSPFGRLEKSALKKSGNRRF